VPAQHLETEAFVLSSRPPQENFQSFNVFAVEHGALFVLQRISRKSGAASATALDLFDEVSLILESSNQGRTWFVRDSRIVARHVEIGRNYETLRFASAFSTLVARNPVHEDSRGALGELLRSALAAFGAGPRPDIVYFKSLYRFARDEGYPLKQQWFPTLPAVDRQEAAALLNRPLAEQSASPALVARLQRRLEEYLRGHTEILLDESPGSLK
jgi:recombinational DNA repair protein (RecF pathway)